MKNYKFKVLMTYEEEFEMYSRMEDRALKEANREEFNKCKAKVFNKPKKAL